MPITPADIHNMAFKKPPIGRRGYEEEEVDALLDEAGQELIRLIEENDDLRHRVHDETAPAPVSPSAAEQDFAELVERLKYMQDAREQAERNARDVQAQLADARGGAVAPADDDRVVRVLMMAQRTADEHVRDARQESDDVVSSARTEAERIAGDARQEASAIESGASRDHAAAMEGLARRRADMLNEIDELEHFASGYRSALGSHVARQLQDIDSTPPAGA